MLILNVLRQYNPDKPDTRYARVAWVVTHARHPHPAPVSNHVMSIFISFPGGSALPVSSQVCL